MDPRITALNARRAELLASMKTLLGDKTALTEDEGNQYDAMQSELDGIPSSIKAVETEVAVNAQRRSALAAAERAVPLLASRSQQDIHASSTAPNIGTVRITSEVMSAEQIQSIPQQQRPIVLTASNGGFRSIGEQLQSIAGAEMNGRYDVDQRLFWNVMSPMAAVSGAGSGVPADGGYLIQKDLMTDLNNKIFSGGELLSRVDTVNIGPGSDGLKVNTINETSRATGSRWGGVQAYWGAEADAATAKKPTFKQTSIELVDLIGLAYVTERLLGDATALESVYSQAFAEEFTFLMEDGIYNGLGAGQPLGFMNSACKVAVTRATASRVKYADIVGMYSRMWSRSRMNAVWLINQDIEPDLNQMAFVVQNVAATENVGGAPAYMPPGGLNDSPYARLMGRPVIPCEYSATLGTSGDIALVDLSEYVFIRKGGLAGDSSIHVRFANNERAFRWIARCNGQPKWVAPVTPFKGSATKSPFIVLS